MRTLMIYKGLQGSGKSTDAAALVRKEPGRWVRINRDDLRGMAVGPGNNPHSRDERREDLMRSFKDGLVRQAFSAGYDVILDDTHLVPATVKKLHQLAASVGDVTVIEKGVNVDIDTCIKRDAARTGFAHVGEKVIRDFARVAGIDKGRKLSDKTSYYPPRGAEGPAPVVLAAAYDPHSELPKAVICDLDGTLSLLNGRNPYDASECDRDLPNLPVIEAVKAFYGQGYQILFTSGRMDKYREPTVRFIERHVRVPNPYWRPDLIGGVSTQVIEYHLFMRATGDQRKDNVIKSELYEANIRGKFNVLLALDDRDQVVDNWRQMGIACFQVAPGAF